MTEEGAGGKFGQSSRKISSQNSEFSLGQDPSQSPSQNTAPSARLIHDVSCSACGGENYAVIDETNGLLRCSYCRNTWIDEHFIKLSETERFLREQAKSPRVVIDNTTETDQQLVQALGGLGLLAGGLNALLRRVLRGCGVIVIACAVIAALALVVLFFLKR